MRRACRTPLRDGCGSPYKFSVLSSKNLSAMLKSPAPRGGRKCLSQFPAGHGLHSWLKSATAVRRARKPAVRLHTCNIYSDSAKRLLPWCIRSKNKALEDTTSQLVRMPCSQCRQTRVREGMHRHSFTAVVF